MGWINRQSTNHPRAPTIDIKENRRYSFNRRQATRRNSSCSANNHADRVLISRRFAEPRQERLVGRHGIRVREKCKRKSTQPAVGLSVLAELPEEKFGCSAADFRFAQKDDMTQTKLHGESLIPQAPEF